MVCCTVTEMLRPMRSICLAKVIPARCIRSVNGLQRMARGSKQQEREV